MQVVDGDSQEGVVGQELPEPLIVRVVDANGDPVPDQLVNFRVVAGGGGVFAGSNITNSRGLVQERWTLGTSTALEQRVEARAVDRETGEAIVFASFTAIPRPGPLSALQKSSGDGQPGAIGATLTQPLVVRAADQYDNAIPGVAVTWGVSSGGGTLSQASITTSDDGTASATWTLGSDLGVAQRVSASAGSHSVGFIANPFLPGDVKVEISGDDQSGTVGQPLGELIVVRVSLPGGSPVAGLAVTWAASNGGSFSIADAATDKDGKASARWTLGTAAGAQTATVQVRGHAPGTLTATARAAAPTSLTIVSGAGQTGSVGTRLPQPFIIEVNDAHGNAVPDAPVTWTVIAGGGTLSNPSGSTGADGRAQTTYTLGTTIGRNEVRATVGALAPAVFVVEAIVGSDIRLEKVSGDKQDGRVGLALAEPLVVRAVDQFGNPIHHVAVVAKAASGGGWFKLGSPAAEIVIHTDQTGLARIPFVPGGRLEPQRVHVVQGSSLVEFTATAQPFVAEQLSLDAPHCAVTPEGRLACWTLPWILGSGANYEMPDRRFTNASISFGHGCAVETGGTLWCWGDNRTGQLGDGTLTSGGPVRPLIEAQVSRVLTGYLNTCAVTSDGRVYCWGVGASMNSRSCRSVFFTNDFVACTPVPTETPAARGMARLDLAMGIGAYAQSAVGLDNGILHSWQPVGGSPTPASTSFPPLVVVDRGQAHTCGLTAAGEAWCHGRLGVIGDGSSYIESVVATRQVSGNQVFVAISAGFEETCALTSAGDAYCWGQLFGRVPTLVPGGLRFREVRTGYSGGSRVACGVTTSGAVACWGYNVRESILQQTPMHVSWPAEP